MIFHSSCAFAGVANMLEKFDVHKEDYELAIGMKLPYLFEYDSEKGMYMTGTALQSADYFNRYLNQLGYHMQEILLSKQAIIEKLKITSYVLMIGITLDNGLKHAVIFNKYQNKQFYFTNNKRFGNEEPDEYIFTEFELNEKLDEFVVMGYLEKCPIKTMDFTPHLQKSVVILQQYRVELITFCKAKQTIEKLNNIKDHLFRPLILDGLAMMELLNHQKIADLQKKLQREFIAILRKEANITPELELLINPINHIFDEYLSLIEHHYCDS